VIRARFPPGQKRFGAVYRRDAAWDSCDRLKLVKPLGNGLCAEIAMRPGARPQLTNNRRRDRER
jgi:hypothetical protein